MRTAAGMLCALMLLSSASAQNKKQQPETVMVTLHAKAGGEADLERVIQKHWATARRLNMVETRPHLTLRKSEGSKTTFLEVFAWRDASIPDMAPAAIQDIWAEMNRLVEDRNGTPGLTFDVVQVVGNPQ